MLFRSNKLDIEPGALVVLNKFHRRKCGIGADAQDVVLSVNIDTCERKYHTKPDKKMTAKSQAWNSDGKRKAARSIR